MRVIVFFTGLLIIPIKQDLKSGPALILYHEKEWHNCFKGLVVLNVIDRLNKLDNNICINKDASKKKESQRLNKSTKTSPERSSSHYCNNKSLKSL